MLFVEGYNGVMETIHRFLLCTAVASLYKLLLIDLTIGPRFRIINIPTGFKEFLSGAGQGFWVADEALQIHALGAPGSIFRTLT